VEGKQNVLPETACERELRMRLPVRPSACQFVRA